MAGAPSPLAGRLSRPPALIVPGAANALAARVVEDLGFEAVYVTGAGIANTYLGVPDIGLVTLSELVGHVAAIRAAVTIPVIVDADTGYGGPLGVRRTVRELERAGADALQLEDQVEPKRCGHFEGARVVSVEDMVSKIRAAADARISPALLLIARTDARSVEGFDAALERAGAYHRAGADLIFIEALQSEAEIRSAAEVIDAPLVLNLVHGGKTPWISRDRLPDGYRILLFANVALQGSLLGMQAALGALAAGHWPADMSGVLASFEERQRIVRKSLYDDLESRYRSQ